MIKIDLNGLGKDIKFFENMYLNLIKKSISGVKNKYDNKELGFIDLDLNNDLDKINSFVSSNKNKYDDIVILGIGGSALGARAIFTALKGKYYNFLSKEKRNNNPRLHILDNVDPIEISNLKEILDYKRTLFIVISKSGRTLETISQFQFFKNEVENNNLDYKKHFVIIAGEDSGFKEESLKKGLIVFDIPNNVGGRFSVFTNVGLLPLAFVGVDIEKLLKGITNVKEKYFSENIEENDSLLASLIQYECYKNDGKNISIFFPYIGNFSYIGAWLKQLVGESLGKAGTGVTLTDSIGVTDQHSQLQLYYDGPDDKLIIFLELEDFENNLSITKDGKIKFSDLMYSEKIGTQKSITDSGKNNYTIKIDKITEETIGELILFFEFQIAILGELYGFNAFDQPGVEIGKDITKKRLVENLGKLEILEGIIK